jgi:hypothetical protein
MDRFQARSAGVEVGGELRSLASLVPYPEINEFFTTDYRARREDRASNAS